MKLDWEEVKLGSLFDITSSKRVFKSEWKDEGVPFFRAREIVKLSKFGEVKNDLFISKEMFEEYSTKYGAPVENDLIITGVGTIGVVYRVRSTDKFYFKDGNCIWLKNKKPSVIPKFIEYLFLSNQVQKQVQNSEGATVKTYTIIRAKNTVIPLPPLEEQKRIVAILDEAFKGLDRARAHTEANLQNAKELFESYIDTLFNTVKKSWSEFTLADVCTLISGQHIAAKNYNTNKLGIGYLTGPSDFGLQNPNVTKWTEHPKRSAKNGDILITVKGSGVGKVNIMNVDELAISRQLMAIRAEGVNASLLYYFIKNKFSYFQALASGAAIPGLSREDVLNLIFSMPPLIDQEKRALALSGWVPNHRQ